MISAELNIESSSFDALLKKSFSETTKKATVPLNSLREQWWERYLQLGFPTRSDESYRPVKLRKIFSTHYTPAAPLLLEPSSLLPYIFPECLNSHLVFLNGRFVPSLSCIKALPSKIVLMPLDQAMKSYRTLLKNYWTQSISEERDAFAALNGALHEEGAFLYFPPKTQCEAPLQVLHLIDSFGSAVWTMPRLFIVGGAQSNATLIHSQHHQREDADFVNQSLDIILDPEAVLNFVQLHTQEDHAGWHFNSCRARLKQDAQFSTLVIKEGGASTRHSYRVALCGERAQASLNGISLLDGTKETHTSILIEHQAPHCHSHQHFKAVLAGASRSSFEGKIVVRSAAQKTEAFQQNHSLLLDDRAHTESRPGLEIYADDVKATHGATIGQLDENQEHYLRTRGLSKIAARNVLVSGFCSALLQEIPLVSVREEMQKRAQGYLK